MDKFYTVKNQEYFNEIHDPEYIDSWEWEKRGWDELVVKGKAGAPMPPMKQQSNGFKRSNLPFMVYMTLFASFLILAAVLSSVAVFAATIALATPLMFPFMYLEKSLKAKEKQESQGEYILEIPWNNKEIQGNRVTQRIQDAHALAEFLNEMKERSESQRDDSVLSRIRYYNLVDEMANRNRKKPKNRGYFNVHLESSYRFNGFHSIQEIASERMERLGRPKSSQIIHGDNNSEAAIPAVNRLREITGSPVEFTALGNNTSMGVATIAGRHHMLVPLSDPLDKNLHRGAEALCFYESLGNKYGETEQLTTAAKRWSNLPRRDRDNLILMMEEISPALSVVQDAEELERSELLSSAVSTLEEIITLGESLAREMNQRLDQVQLDSIKVSNNFLQDKFKGEAREIHPLRR